MNLTREAKLHILREYCHAYPTCGNGCVFDHSSMGCSMNYRDEDNTDKSFKYLEENDKDFVEKAISELTQVDNIADEQRAKAVYEALGFDKYVVDKNDTVESAPTLWPKENPYINIHEDTGVAYGQIPVDMVNHPGHYESGKFECIDVMLETQGKEAVMGFCICNAFKYLYRHNRKNGIEDVKKAVWYLNKYFELAEEDNDD